MTNPAGTTAEQVDPHVDPQTLATNTDMTDAAHSAPPKKPVTGLAADSLAAGLPLLLMLTVGQRFVGFGRNLLFCRWLEPAELGRWNLAFSLLILAAPMVMLGLPGSFGRYVEHYRQKGQLKSFLRRAGLLTIAISLSGIALMCVFRRTAAYLFFGDANLTSLLLASVTCLASVIIFNYLAELFTALRQLKVVSYMQIANSVLFATFALSLIYRWQASAMSVIAGYGIACFITGFVASITLWRRWKTLDDEGPPLSHTSLWRKLLPFAGWIWFSDLVVNLFAAADRYMIVHFAKFSTEESAEIIGQYHSSLVIPVLLLAIASMVASVIMPYFSSDWERGNRVSVARNTNATLQLYGFGAFCAGAAVLLFSPLVFGWALQGKYDGGLSVLPWTLTISVWAGLLAISMCYLRCAERVGIATVGPVIGLVANVALNLVLLPRLGLLGAVLATAAANLLTFLIGLYVCSREGFQIERGTILIALLPLCLTLGLPIALLSAVVTLWAIVRTEWVCSRENKESLLDQWQKRMPNRFTQISYRPLFSLPATE